LEEKNDYPVYKKVIWRFVRVFMVAFLAQVASIQPDKLDMWLFLAFTAGVAACLEAGAKALREATSDNYKHWLHKLPF
jgi:hypothetical protein